MNRVWYPASVSARCASKQGTSHCIGSLDPGANGLLWGQMCKPWRQVVCERLYTSQGAKNDIQMDVYIVKAQWPWKVLVKVCRAELWAWMWTENTDFTFTLKIYLYSPYHGWWWLGDTRSQGTIGYLIDLFLLEYLKHSPWGVKCMLICHNSVFETYMAANMITDLSTLLSFTFKG